MQLASLDSYANHPKDEVLRACHCLNCYLILVTMAMPVSEVNVAAQPALAVCTSSSLAFFKPQSSVFSTAQENKVLRVLFLEPQDSDFHSFNTTFKECITQLTSNQKLVAPLLLGPWQHLTAFTWLKRMKCKVWTCNLPLQLSPYNSIQ